MLFRLALSGITTPGGRHSNPPLVDPGGEGCARAQRKATCWRLIFAQIFLHADPGGSACLCRHSKPVFFFVVDCYPQGALWAPTPSRGGVVLGNNENALVASKAAEFFFQSLFDQFRHILSK